MLFINSYPYISRQFVAAGQIFFNINSSEANYRTYENSTAGIQIEYPSNWKRLENLGNVSGNYILADFYITGISGT